jgi:hypothetical protein
VVSQAHISEEKITFLDHLHQKTTGLSETKLELEKFAQRQSCGNYAADMVLQKSLLRKSLLRWFKSGKTFRRAAVFASFLNSG